MRRKFIARSQSETLEARPRVLIVAPQPFFLEAGTPLNVRTMCIALADLGYQVHLAVLPMGKTIELRNVVCHKVWRLPLIRHVPIGFSIGKALYDVGLAALLVLLLARHRFAAVHAIEEAAFFSVPIARMFRVPAIMDLDSDIAAQLREHPSRVARALTGLVSPIRRFALRGSACAITVAESLTRLVARESPRTRVAEIKDIPPRETLRRPEPQLVEELRRELGLESRRVIVYTGNFDQRQGMDILVGAMPLVVGRWSDAQLLLVGGTPAEIDRMRQVAVSLGVSENIHFAGKRTADTMPEFMALATVLVSPRVEPLVTPLKIYAYMASGRPIVATDLPTHTQVLDDTSALLVPATAEGLAAGILEALDDPDRAAGRAKRARELVQSKHSFDNFKRQLGEVYDFVTECGSPAGRLRQPR